MKINELIGVKSDPVYQKAKATFADEPVLWNKQGVRHNKLKTFTDFLVNQGFKPVGSGSFARVYEKSGYPWLFKLFNHDNAYEQYIKWVIKNQNNPNVPKIKGGLVPITKSTYVVRMEKLQPIKIEQFSSSVSPEIEKLIRALDAFNDTREASNENTWIKKNYPGIWSILKALENIGNHNDVSLDLHSHNIMMRGDTPVITDPLYDPHEI